MHLIFWTILVVGLSGLVAQALLLRELLVSFYGNELTLGIILANWVVQEALGVLIMGRYIDKVKNKINIFVLLEIVFSLTFPIVIYFSRTYKNFIGIPSGEAVGLYTIFWASFFIILPVSFCHGALFSVGCKIYSLLNNKTQTFHKTEAISIGKVYAWETLGTIIGGVVLTYLFIPYLSSFKIVFIVAILNLVISFLILNFIAKTKLGYIVLSIAVLLIYSGISGNLNLLDRISVDRQWKGLRVLEYRNSIYGNIAVTKQLEQYTFYYNGLPLLTTPYPDIQFVEEFAHLPLLFHQAPRDVLIVSAGAGGLINEILKHRVRIIDYVEIDPLVIKMLKEFPTELTESELNDKRVNVINTDGRFYLKTDTHLYDVVLIGLSNPSDLSTNRFFTEEFFALVEDRLNPQGLMAFCLPGSLTYLSRELKDLNGCILNTLRKVYKYVRVIPGDYNLYLASSSGSIKKVTSRAIYEKLIDKEINSRILTVGYLDYRLNQYWVDWFRHSLEGATKEINNDLKPYAVFKMLIFWNKKFSPQLTPILEYFENLDLRRLSIFILVLMALFMFYMFYRRDNLHLIIANSIASTGFFGMLANLILIFSYQIFYGYLYHRIGLLISLFMAGTALGSIIISARIEKIRRPKDLFLLLEISIVIFVFLMAITLRNFSWIGAPALIIFISLFFISGFFLGLEFPLASKIYLGGKKQVGEVAGTLYALDLLGGWIAGILGGIVLLPVLGLFNTCLLIIVVKLSSIVLILCHKFQAYFGIGKNL